MALYQLWCRNKWVTPIYIKRSEVMKLAKIGSSATYHKCLRQLIEIGCIHYEPSPNPALKSKVYLILEDKSKREAAMQERNPEAEGLKTAIM